MEQVMNMFYFQVDLQRQLEEAASCSLYHHHCHQHY
jgi:hypothetical protein